MNKRVKMLTCYTIAEILCESSSDSSDEDELLNLIYPSVRNIRPRIKNYFDVIHEYSNAEFKSHFRISRRVFYFLLNIIEPQLLKQSERYGRKTFSAEAQLLVAIWTMATPDSYRSVCDRFDIGRATAWRAVRRVSAALYRLASQYIKWPNEEEAKYTWTNIELKYGFPKVLGAIDGTHIKITKPTKHDESYINRKGYHSVQLQVICDSTLKFIHCYAGQPGSIHDMRVFRLSGFQTMCTDNFFPADSHILGDAAYTLQKHIMVPFRNNGHLTEAQINFNYHICSARVMVERAIGLLKGRFRSLLDKLHMRRIDLIPEYIIACCILHNICILNNDFIDIPIIIEENDINVLNNEDEDGQVGIEKRNAITYMLSQK